jgi:hypothetical protein
MEMIKRFGEKLGDPKLGEQKKDEVFAQFEDKIEAYKFSKELGDSPAMEEIGNYLKEELNGDSAKLVAVSTPQVEGLISLYKEGKLPEFLDKIENDLPYRTEFALATQNGDAKNFIADFKKPTVQPQHNQSPAPQDPGPGISVLDGVADMLPSTDPESKYGDNIQKLIDASPVMLRGSLEQEMDALQNKGELPAFEQKLVNNPDYQSQLNQAAASGDTNQLSTLISTHASVSLPASAVQPTTQPQQTERKVQTEAQPTAEEIAQFEAAQTIMEFIDEHVAKNPNDKELGQHFKEGVTKDKELQDALAKFQKNNADMLKAGGDDDMVSGMLDKDAMVHDLLASYKDTPETAYAALADDNFQMQAFLQYSPIGQAAGFILEPLMQMLGGFMGQGSNLASWAEADFGDIMKDFQSFFSNEMGNVMGMGNNDLGLFERLGKVVNAVGYAAEDALDVTRYDRHYMPEHNAAASEVKIKHVGEGNDITEKSIDLAGGPDVTTPVIDPFDPDKPENNNLNQGLDSPGPGMIA